MVHLAHTKLSKQQRKALINRFMRNQTSIPTEFTSQAPLGQLLIRSAKITSEQLDQALAEQKQSDVHAILKQKACYAKFDFSNIWKFKTFLKHVL